MFFTNLQIYRLPAPWAFTPDQLEAALAPHAFVPCSSNDLLRQGWDAPRGAGQLVHTVNRQMLVELRAEKKLLPTSVINQVAKVKAAELEEAQGFAPGRKAMKELKERVADELLPRAFSVESTTRAWIDPVNGWLVVDTASPAKSDEVIKQLLKAVDKLPLESLRVQRAPVAVMTGWLEQDEAPAGFTVDQDAVMRACGESKSQVSYKHHALEHDDISRHIAAGKQCARLALTWRDKISFVLTETLAIKSVKALDVLKESEASTKNDEERFDGDMVLMTGELAQLLADLVASLGGEVGDLASPAGPARQAGEREIKMAATLYEARAGAKSTLGAGYFDRMGELAGDILICMHAKNLSEVAAATHLCTLTGDPTLQMQILAAAVELVEPTKPTGQRNDVPAGDGSATDPLYEQAVTIVRAHQRASISLVQRHLVIGYNRAARIIEAMEAAGVLSGTQGIYTVLPETQGAGAAA